MSLLDSINRFATKAALQASDSTNKIVEEYFITNVKLSPTEPKAAYSQGVLINNWWPSIGPTPSTEVSKSANIAGADSIARIKSTLAQNPFLGRNNTVTLSNNVSYAYRADKLGWPRGLDSESGWTWRGDVGPYMMTSLARSHIMRHKT